MIPLRGVPFRVVCVAGFDDDAVAPRDGESDDLVDRQQLCGDLDPRLEIRRSLLDCLLAAQQRLIITCTGRSVVNNATTPLATPLAELVDFVGRHGVPVSERKDGEASEIEVFHPRHACSRDNFRVGALRATGVWSHDPAAAATAASLGSEPPWEPSCTTRSGRLSARRSRSIPGVTTPRSFRRSCPWSSPGSSDGICETATSSR